MPRQYEHIFSLLLDRNNSGPTFFQEQLQGSNVPKSIDVFPIFQAAHVISEDLTDGLVSSFFLFLREGDIEDFVQRIPSPNEIFRALELSEHSLDSIWSFGSPAAVVAGFIRYTEFLTAMDSLFPTGYMLQHGGEQTSALESMRNREALAEEIKEIIGWRIPNTSRGFVAYQTVRATFLQIVSDQFHQRPDSVLQWSPVETYAELIRLADRFFGLKERVLEGAAKGSTYTGAVSAEIAASFREIGDADISVTARPPDEDEEEHPGLEVS